MKFYIFFFFFGAVYFLSAVFFGWIQSKIKDEEKIPSNPTRTEDIDFKKYGWEPHRITEFDEEYRHKDYDNYYLWLSLSKDSWRLMVLKGNRYKEVKEEDGIMGIEIYGRISNEDLESLGNLLKGYKPLKPDHYQRLVEQSN